MEQQILSPRILVVLFGAIGDVTRALPLAVRIKRAWPESHITWAVEPISRPLVSGHPAIDSVVVFERSRGLGGYRDFLRELHADGRNYDLTLDLQRHLKSGFTSWKSKAPRRIGFHPKNTKEGNHFFQTEYIDAVDNWSPKIGHYQLFGDRLGLPKFQTLEFGFVSLPEEQTKVEELLAPLLHVSRDKRVAFILGSSWPSRFWFPEHYQRLARKLADDLGMKIVLVGASGEKTIAEEICSGQGLPEMLNLVGKTSLRDLIPLFSQIPLAIGSDSGPMHIAAAQGAKVISLWGSTSPLRSAPYRSEKLVLQSALGCSPCYRKHCPGLGRLCMSEIPPEAVLARVQEIAENRQELGV